MFSLRLPIVLSLGGLLLVPGRGASQEHPTFIGRVDLVRMDVTVLDKDRRPVPGLRATDFVLTVDGKTRPIAAVSEVMLDAGPAGSISANEAQPDINGDRDVLTNQIPARGRMVVIMLDRSIPSEQGVVRAREIARATVDALGPDDLAAVVYDGGFHSEGSAQNFTADHDLLRAAIDAPMIGLVNPPDMTKDGLSRAAPDIRHTGDCVCGLCVLDAIGRTADALASETQRRKIIVWIGSAIVLQERPTDPHECFGLVRPQRERTLRSLDRANVTFHALDPTGLETLARTADSFPMDQRRTVDRTLERQADLAVLPSYTGGRTVLNTNRPEAAVPALFRESQDYYLLAFDATGMDPHVEHRIKVLVNRKGTTVNARRFSYGSAESPSSHAADDHAPVAQTITGLLPRRDFPLAMSLVPEFSSAGASGIFVQVQAHPAQQPVEPMSFDGLVVVLTPSASRVTERRFELRAETTMSSYGTWLPLAPGRYDVRAGLRDSTSGVASSIYGYITVPNVQETGFSLSGLELAEIPAQGKITPSAIVPTLDRAFSGSVRVWATVQIRRGVHEMNSITLRSIVWNGQHRIEFTESVTLRDADFTPAGIAVWRLEIPIARLAPGDHHLSITASDDHSPTLNRALSFHAEP